MTAHHHLVFTSLLVVTLASASLGAADGVIETFVLRDGRTVTGIYDDTARAIRVQSGTMTASVAVDPSDIVRREPAMVPVPAPRREPVAQSPPPPTPKAADDGSLDRMLGEVKQAEEQRVNQQRLAQHMVDAQRQFDGDVSEFRFLFAADAEPAAAARAWKLLAAAWERPTTTTPIGDTAALRREVFASGVPAAQQTLAAQLARDELLRLRNDVLAARTAKASATATADDAARQAAAERAAADKAAAGRAAADKAIAEAAAAGEAAAAAAKQDADAWARLESLAGDLAKYRTIAASDAGKGMAQAAWDAVLRKWGLPPGSIVRDNDIGLMSALTPDVRNRQNAGGLFAGRTTRRFMAAINGGTLRSEAAVEASLRWFKKHQSTNGMWDAEKYFQNCTEDPKCEPGTLAGHGAEEINVAMTGYALLCFLSAGYDHKTPNTYTSVVKKGLEYLRNIQAPDGMLGKRNYEHPIATMALVEAFAMTADPDLRKAAQLGVDMIIKKQNQDPKGASGNNGLGWDYVNQSNRNDASVTGWNVMALKSANAAGLKVGNGLKGARSWLDNSWRANNDGQGGRPDWKKLDATKDQSLFSYCWPMGATTFQESFGHQNMAPVGLVCAAFLERRTGDKMLDSLANYVMNKQMPKAYPTNSYYLYYNTLGLFQVGGERWTTWNAMVRDMLIGAQRTGDGCLAGSWDWQGTQFHGNDIGRALSTAYNTLCLEVYYRYARVQEPKR